MSTSRDPFAALADPTRRAILELLRERPTMTAGEIATEFPTISRPAVSKHLGVLRGAALVRVTEQGREWHYALDPGPLEEIYERWFGPFAALWDDSLRELKRRVEARPTRAAPRARTRPR